MGKAILDVFLPRSCVHCGGTVENTSLEYICKPCSDEIFPCLPPACNTCGYPFFGEITGTKVCPHCSELDPVFEQGKSLFLAKGPARTILHELKYKNGFYVLKDLLKMVQSTPHFLKYIRDASLIPVPLHPTKLRERTYNQSLMLAEMLAKASDGSSVVEEILTRSVFTQTQTKLNRDERHQNVKNAFALRPNAVLIPEKQYIIIDDVFTTGSTLNACALTLHEAGATRVKVATIGHG